MKPFTLRAAWKLRRALRDNRYDLVITCYNADPIWRIDTGWFRNAFKLLKESPAQSRLSGHRPRPLDTGRVIGTSGGL